MTVRDTSSLCIEALATALADGTGVHPAVPAHTPRSMSCRMNFVGKSNILRSALIGAIALGSQATFVPSATAMSNVDRCGGAVAIGTIGENLLERNNRNFAVIDFVPTRAGKLSWWCGTGTGWVRNTVACEGDEDSPHRLVYATVEHRDIIRIEC